MNTIRIKVMNYMSMNEFYLSLNCMLHFTKKSPHYVKIQMTKNHFKTRGFIYAIAKHTRK